MSRITRGSLSLVLIVATAVGALFIVYFPDRLPSLIDPVLRYVEREQMAVVIALAVGILIFLVSMNRLIYSTAQIDHSIISEYDYRPPSSGLKRPGDSLNTVFEGAISEVNDLGIGDRHLMVYGRRTLDRRDSPRKLNQTFNVLVELATRTTATAENLSSEDALTQVNEGTWTDDRIAAAFLASDIDCSAQFKFRERLISWLFPSLIFKRRVERVLTTIESTGGTFLTYDSSPRIGTIDIAGDQQ